MNQIQNSVIQRQEVGSMTNLQIAMELASRGYFVHPCGPRSKKPITTHGFQDASLEQLQIAAWWQKDPFANIAIRTGKISNLFVLDIDGDKGASSLKALEGKYGALPPTVESTTPNGRHLYFEYPGGDIRSRAGNIAPGIDVRANDGYVIAPPSIHPSGKPYTWKKNHSLGDIPLAAVPGWLLDRAIQKKSPKRQEQSAPHQNGKIPVHQRNATLTSLAGSMRRRDMSESAIRAALLKENAERCEEALEANEIEGIVKSIGRYPAAKQDIMLSANFTDDGNAQRLQAFCGDDLLYVHEWNEWLVWGEHLYRPGKHGEAIRLAKNLNQHLYAIASNIEDDETRRKFVSNARRLESVYHRRSMLESAQSLMPVMICDLDTHHFLFNVLNGTIELKTGQLRPGRRKDLLTKCSPVMFDPAAKCPQFQKFSAEIFLNDPDLIKFIQKLFGYILSGDISEQCFFVFYGTGKNGKTTLLEIMKALLGQYAAKTRAETFLSRRSDSIPNDLAALQGARLVAAVEPDAGRRLDESRIKEFTGKDTVSARRLHSEFFEFRPEGKLIIATNKKPQIFGRDEGIWRRVRLVPFNKYIEDADQNQHMEEVLLNELPGILNWAIEGFRLWQAEGLGLPPEVQSATDAYRQEGETLQRFIADECKVGPKEKIQNKQFRRKYEEWCDENGESPLPAKEFRPALEEAGFTRVKVNGANIWKGVGLGGWC